jgi:hypothetical protein
MAADFFFHGALHVISDSEGAGIQRPEAECDLAVFGHPCNGVPRPPGRTSLKSYLLLLQRDAEPGWPAGRCAERSQKLQEMAVFPRNSSICTLRRPGGSWVGTREASSVVSLPPSSFGLHPSLERQSGCALRAMEPAMCRMLRYRILHPSSLILAMEPALCVMIRDPDPSRSGGRGSPGPAARSICAMWRALERGLWPGVDGYLSARTTYGQFYSFFSAMDWALVTFTAEKMISFLAKLHGQSVLRHGQ